MKMLTGFLLALLMGLPASAHPGKTDRQGGHKCHKDCAEWDLYYAEYHLHDKDGRAVKVARKKPVRQKSAVAPAEEKAVGPVGSPAVAAPSPLVAAAAADIASDIPSLSWILLLLFLLLFLAVRRRRRKAS